MKYRVLRDCFGFQGRYWVAGEVVDLPASPKPPEHFEPVKGSASEKPSAPAPETPKGEGSSSEGEPSTEGETDPGSPSSTKDKPKGRK